MDSNAYLLFQMKSKATSKQWNAQQNTFHAVLLIYLLKSLFSEQIFNKKTFFQLFRRLWKVAFLLEERLEAASQQVQIW